MTIIATSPPITLSAGSFLFKPQVDIPVGSNQVIVRILKMGWPGTGQKVGDFVVAYAVAGGDPIQIISSDVYDVADDTNPLPIADRIPFPLDGRRRLIVSGNLLVGGLQAVVSVEANVIPAAKA